MVDEWLRVTYGVRAGTGQIKARARAIALEQSVEMAFESVTNPWVRDHIVGRVENIAWNGHRDAYEVAVDLSALTVGDNPAQLLSMVFGNVSLQSDVELLDVELPASVVAAFSGPSHGLAGLRLLVGAPSDRALTCSALKPQGAPVAELAELCRVFASAGIDVVKDDHGLADQAAAPFAERVAACQKAVSQAGTATVYAPSIVGGPRRVARQLAVAAAEGVTVVLMAPMVYGLPAFAEVVADHPDMAFVAHPAFAGTGRVTPAVLLGRLFRLYGADAVIFPNYGGRFAYSADQCRALADGARRPWHHLRASAPVPAGGMSVERVDEMLEFYGPDAMLLISGDLLTSEDVGARAARFADAVRSGR